MSFLFINMMIDAGGTGACDRDYFLFDNLAHYPLGQGNGNDGCYPAVDGICHAVCCEVALNKSFVNGFDPSTNSKPQPPFDPYYTLPGNNNYTIGAGRDATPAGFLRSHVQDAQINMVSTPTLV